MNKAEVEKIFQDYVEDCNDPYYYATLNAKEINEIKERLTRLTEKAYREGMLNVSELILSGKIPVMYRSKETIATRIKCEAEASDE